MAEKREWKRGPSASVLSVLLILFSLGLLAFLPGLLEKKNFTYEIQAGSTEQTSRFPIETSLPLLRESGSSNQTSIKQLMAENSSGAIVNFWATWCPPCLEELPGLEYLNRELNAKKGSLPLLITISVDESPDDVFSLYKTLDFKPSFSVLYDKDARLSRLVGTTKFPETYWVSPEGKVLHKWVGPQNWLSNDVVTKLGNLSKR